MAISNQKIPKNNKRVLIVFALAGLCVFSLIFNAVTGGKYVAPATPAEPDVSVNQSVEETLVSPEAVQADETSALPESVQADTDWDIITRAGHPTYYGSVAQSHAIWNDVPKGKIIFADSLSKWDKRSVLSMSCYRNSDLIRNVYVSLSQFEIPVSLTIDEVLPVVASYMPFDILSQYYEYRRSLKILPDVQAASNDIYYVISYGLTDDAKAAYASHEHEYSGTIDVIVETNSDGVVQNFSIGFGTPKWMSFLETNSRYPEEWHCDLRDYQ